MFHVVSGHKVFLACFERVRSVLLCTMQGPGQLKIKSHFVTNVFTDLVTVLGLVPRRIHLCQNAKQQRKSGVSG